jgi:protease-4
MKYNHKTILLLIMTSASLLCPNAKAEFDPWSITPYVVGGSLTCAALATVGLLSKYMKTEPASNIACITFDGPVNHTQALVYKLMAIQGDPRFDAVLLIINSPGGRPGQSEILHHLIRTIAQEKPVVVCVVDNCCSGGYLIASAATKIVAPAVSSIGCIGVLNTSVKEFPEKYDDHGNQGTVEVFPIAAGKYKSIHHPNMPLTDDEKKHLQQSAEKLYDAFCRIVAYARGLDFNARNQWAEGIVFSGAEALELRLIDYIGGINEAIQVVKIELQKKGKTHEQVHLLSIA